MAVDASAPRPVLRLQFPVPLRLRVEGLDAAAAEGLAHEYAPYVVETLDEPDIDIACLGEARGGERRDEVQLGGPRSSKLSFRVVEVPEVSARKRRVEIRPVSGGVRLTAHGAVRHVVEPALYAALPVFGAAFVHGAAVSFGDGGAARGLAIFGAQGSGKTGAVLWLLGARPATEAAKFLAGDKFMLGGDGSAFGYARCQHLSRWTLDRFPEVLERLRHSNEPLVSRLRARLRLWRKGEVRCRIEEALPGVAIAARAPLRAAVWLERILSGAVEASEMPHEELSALVSEDSRREFRRVEPLAAAFDTQAAASEIVQRALAGVRAFRLTVPDGAPPERIGEMLIEVAGRG